MGFCFSLVASIYGWTHQEILKLSARQFFMYVEQIPILQARKQMSYFEVSAFPYMDKQGQKEVLDHYTKIIEDASMKQKTDQKVIDANWDLLRRGIMPDD